MLAVTEIVVDEVPVFLTVIILAALVSPTAVEAKASEAGVTVTVVLPVEVPVPDKDTLCGEVDALSVMVMLPGRLPLVVGENVTLIVQVAPPPKEEVQLFVWP